MERRGSFPDEEEYSLQSNMIVEAAAVGPEEETRQGRREKGSFENRSEGGSEQDEDPCWKGGRRG